jgi:hypothetical protein
MWEPRAFGVPATHLMARWFLNQFIPRSLTWFRHGYDMGSNTPSTCRQRTYTLSVLISCSLYSHPFLAFTGRQTCHVLDYLFLL